MGLTDEREGREGVQLGRSATMDDLLAASRGVDEKKLVRKLDLYLIPLIMGVYLFSFVDRYDSSLFTFYL